MNQDKKQRQLLIYYPLMLAVMLVLGLYLGTYFSGGQTTYSFLPEAPNGAQKISQVIRYIESEYVDSVKKEQLIDRAISSLLSDLDPHSYYISAEELLAYTEPLEGNFEGIGVEFMIQEDTVYVVSALEGGPSEKLGIMAGDQIVAVNGKNIAGTGITNEQVIRLLKGESGTEVQVDILRDEKTIPFTITRGTIPLNSLVTAQMLPHNTGYIKLSRFARTTYEEFMEAAEDLEDQGMKSLVLDLRGNGGGYLGIAVQIIEEFLQKGQLIVYTQGKASPKQEYYSSKKGTYSNLPLVVLINQGSASASEILAGAIQDNDRGLIVGRRSFGKGLVQEHLDLRDHSALRLTVARYYTPTGRSIQKPYGHGIDYSADLKERYVHGELQVADSIHFADSLKYTTPGGRTVYGGGGIMPDIFVPLDTNGASYYLNQVTYMGLINKFAFDYATKHRDMLMEKYSDYTSFKRNFELSEATFQKFVDYATETGVEPVAEEIQHSRQVIKLRIKAYISRNLYGNDGYYSVIFADDNILQEALKTLDNNKTASVFME